MRTHPSTGRLGGRKLRRSSPRGCQRRPELVSVARWCQSQAPRRACGGVWRATAQLRSFRQSQTETAVPLEAHGLKPLLTKLCETLESAPQMPSKNVRKPLRRPMSQAVQELLRKNKLSLCGHPIGMHGLRCRTATSPDCDTHFATLAHSWRPRLANKRMMPRALMSRPAGNSVMTSLKMDSSLGAFAGIALALPHTCCSARAVCPEARRYDFRENGDYVYKGHKYG